MYILKDILYKLYDRKTEYYDIQDCIEQEYCGRKFNKTAIKKETIKFRNLNKINQYDIETYTTDRIRYFEPKKFYIKINQLKNIINHLKMLNKSTNEEFSKVYVYYRDRGLKDNDIGKLKDFEPIRLFLLKLKENLLFIKTLKVGRELNYEEFWVYLCQFNEHFDVIDENGLQYKYTQCFVPNDIFEIIN